MNIQEEIEKVEQKANCLEKKSLAFSLYEDYRKANTRLFIVIIFLLVYSAFITYKYIDIIKDYGTETITEITDTEGIGNACIGDNCYNGDINGESN